MSRIQIRPYRKEVAECQVRQISVKRAGKGGKTIWSGQWVRQKSLLHSLVPNKDTVQEGKLLQADVSIQS